MRRYLILVPLAVALIAAAPEPQPGPGAPEKRVCRSELELGSRIPKRRCMTRQEWTDEAAAARQTASRAAENRLNRPPNN